MRTLLQELQKIKLDLEEQARRATTFTEEVLMQDVLYAVNNALDVIEGHKTLLQGLTGGESNARQE
jgi:phage shock protein A